MPTFRLATLSDIDQLIELRVLMQLEVNASQETPVAYEKAVRAYFSECLADGSYASAVAEKDGKLVAANGLIIYRKPPSVIGIGGKQGYVSNVYTRSEWRGRGIARELMQLLIAHARAQGVEKLHLGATDAGVGVYESVGFTPPRFPQLELKLVTPPSSRPRA